MGRPRDGGWELVLPWSSTDGGWSLICYRIVVKHGALHYAKSRRFVHLLPFCFVLE